MRGFGTMLPRRLRERKKYERGALKASSRNGLQCRRQAKAATLVIQHQQIGQMLLMQHIADRRDQPRKPERIRAIPGTPGCA
jgi:hypothetical protein